MEEEDLPPPPPPPPKAAPVESAWERGLRHAKEVKTSIFIQYIKNCSIVIHTYMHMMHMKNCT